MSLPQWVAIKVGDRLIVGSAIEGYDLVTVDRLTATLICCGYRRYSRATGRQVSGRGRAIIRVATPEDLARDDLERQLVTLRRRLDAACRIGRRIKLGVLERAVPLLGAAVDALEAP